MRYGGITNQKYGNVIIEANNPLNKIFLLSHLISNNFFVIKNNNGISIISVINNLIIKQKLYE